MTDVAGVVGTTHAFGEREIVVALGVAEAGGVVVAVNEQTQILLLGREEFQEDESVEISGEFKNYVEYLHRAHDIEGIKEELLRQLKRES